MAETNDHIAIGVEALEPNPEMRAGLEELAEHYRRLAEQDPGGGLIIEFELPSKPQN